MGEVSILGFKKAQVFCIKNSSCVKTGKSLRAIATHLTSIDFDCCCHQCVKTGKSLRRLRKFGNEGWRMQNRKFCTSITLHG